MKLQIESAKAGRSAWRVLNDKVGFSAFLLPEPPM
jgi:hypothetical protein